MRRFKVSQALLISLLVTVAGCDRSKPPEGLDETNEKVHGAESTNDTLAGQTHDSPSNAFLMRINW